MTDDMTDPTALEKGALVRLADHPPAELPAIVLDDLVPFPGPIVPLLLDRDQRREAVLTAKNATGYFLVVNRLGARPAVRAPGTPAAVDMGGGDELRIGNEDARRAGEDAASEPSAPPAGRPSATLQQGDGAEPVRALTELSAMGILAKLVRVFRLPDDRMSALVQLVSRARPIDIVRAEPFLVLRVLHPAEVVHDEDEFQAIYRQLRINLQSFFEAHPAVSEELKMPAMNIERPGIIADFVAQHLSRDYDERLSFLVELDVGKRLRHALEVTIRELDLLTVGNRISQEIRDKVEKHQREYLLREQLKAIRTELGEEKDPAQLAVVELAKKLDDAGLPKAARERADEELKRLQLLPAEAPEHNIVRSYLEWIAALPWSKVTDDNTDIERARRILDADHYGLADVKDRILEFLAVRQLNPQKAGSLLCFAGPPGVGKTSLGKSIATALGRPFYRFSVGGTRDEAEIKGHRRTYIGAMPGRILQGLKQVGTANPVFMLDELDKIGSDWRGDPSSALLEVLDPAQNTSFNDHYLDLPFDLSRVMFIATCNVKSEIPDALRDRLEIIDLAGYIPEEKLEIATRFLLPRQRAEAGLTPKHLALGKAAIMRVVREYTHEAGVRELDRQMARICRKRAGDVVRGKTALVRVGPDDVPTFLGPPKIQTDRLTRRQKPGVALGLAWTPVGGDVLVIETVSMTGKGTLKLTGQLGEVMTESASIAMSFVRTRAAALGVDAASFTERDLHVHFPAGAVKKDGPSAGVTITTALISLLTGRAVEPRLAMTGEMTLRGEVLPVGGIREKVVAARRAGVKRVVIPARNAADVEEIPAEVRADVEFVFATTFDDVLAAALPGTGAAPPAHAAGRARSRGVKVAAARAKAARP